MERFAVCSRKLQFEAGPEQTTFYACTEHRPKLERGEVMCFFPVARHQIQEVDPNDEIECDYCREP